MSKSKKIVSLVLSLVMSLTAMLIPSTVLAETESSGEQSATEQEIEKSVIKDKFSADKERVDVKSTSEKNQGIRINQASTNRYGLVGKLTNADFLTGIAIDGKFYDVSDSFDMYDKATSIWAEYDDKTVLCICNGEKQIEEIYSIREILERKITIDTGGLSKLAYQSGSFEKNEFEITIQVSNKLRKEFSWLPQELLKKLTINLGKLSVKAGANTKLIDSSDTIQIKKSEIKKTLNQPLEAQDVESYNFRVYIDDKYVPEKIDTSLDVSCKLTTDMDTELSGVEYINVVNLDLQREEAKRKALESERRNNIIKCNQALSGHTAAVALDPKLNEYLTAAQEKETLRFLETWIASLYAFPTSESSTVDEKIMDKVLGKLGVDKTTTGLLGNSKTEASIDMKASTKQGEKKIRFDLLLKDYVAGKDGIPQASFGTLTFTIYPEKSFRKEYESLEMPVTSTNLNAFMKTLQAVANGAINSAYMGVWGKNADKAADYIVEGTVLETINYKETIGRFSDNMYELLVLPAEQSIKRSSVTAQTAGETSEITSGERYLDVQIIGDVDVAVYNDRGSLRGTIKNNEVQKTDNDVFLYTDGTQKGACLMEDEYYIELTGRSSTNVNYVIQEKDDTGEVLRTIKYNDVPFISGQTYKAALPASALLTSSLYDLIGADGKVITATSDVFNESQASTKPENPEEPTQPSDSEIDKEGKCGDGVNYRRYRNGTLEIYGNGEMYDYDDEDNRAPYFYSTSYSQIKKVIVKSGVTKIGNYAFGGRWADDITSITLPNSVTSIGDSAFRGCDDLANITIPNNVKSIGNSAFQACYSLETVTIPDSVKSIGDSAFFACNKLQRLTIGKNVETIGDGAFYGCEALISVRIPDKVKKIGKSAFECCRNMKTLTTGKNLTNIGTNAFFLCSSLSDVTIYGKIVSDYMFRSEPLKTLTLGKNVTTIGQLAFAECPLTKVTVQGQIIKMGDQAFAGCGSLKTLDLRNVKTIGTRAFAGCKNLKTLTLGKNLKAIPEGAFYYCSVLEKVTIPDKVAKIGDNAFALCKKLKSLNIGKDVANIGESAFESCESVTKVMIPNRVTKIEESTFRSCSNLKTLVLGKNVKSIEERAFEYCGCLTKVVVPNRTKKIDQYAFSDCKGLKTLVLGKNVTLIGAWAFAGCKKVTKLMIPDKITKIEDDTFTYCKNLKTLIIGKNVAKIGNGAFYGCKKLNNITIKTKKLTNKGVGTSIFGETAAKVTVKVPN